MRSIKGPAIFLAQFAGDAPARRDRACHVLGCPGVALLLSLAAAAGRSGRDGVRRAGAALAPDSRRVRRKRGQRLLRDPSGRGSARRGDVRDVPRASRRARALQPVVRSQSLHAAAARLSRVYRPLSRPHPHVSRQGCRVQSDRPPGRVWRIPVVGQSRRPVPFPGRRSGELQGDLLEAGAVRLPRLGGARVGVLPQAPGGRCPRRGEVHRRSHHPGDGTGVRRFRRRRHRPGRESPDARHRLTMVQPLRLGMVGGGRGAFIGGVHRLCARLDGQYELVAGALSSDPQRARESSAALGLAPDRIYASFAEMAAAEAQRSDGIEVVSIVTPNDSHHAIARAFLDRGIDVICDKPMTTTVEDALDLVQTVRRTGLIFGVTHNYTGYPMVRQAREMTFAGELGTIRVVQAEYVQDWLTTKLEDTGQKEAAWRVDPARAGAGGCLGDIGTHAYNLAGFVTGLAVRELAADLSRFVPGRRLDDNVHMLLRFENGARGMLWGSQVAPGNENGLRLRVYGEKAGLEWSQEHPNQLRFAPVGQPPRVLSRGGPNLSPAASRGTRPSYAPGRSGQEHQLPHPKGYWGQERPLSPVLSPIQRRA